MNFFAALAEDEIAAADPGTWASETTVALAPPSIVRLPNEPKSQLPWQSEPAPARQALHTDGKTARNRPLGSGAPAAEIRRGQSTLASGRARSCRHQRTKRCWNSTPSPPPARGPSFIAIPSSRPAAVTVPSCAAANKQVPEGVYGISFLNPNSRYHVALARELPNAFDRRMGSMDGRSDLGGDIMIHGKAASVGCLAIGDEAAEELFVLAAETGLRNIKLVIAPTDFRKNPPPVPLDGQPAWLPALYTKSPPL